MNILENTTKLSDCIANYLREDAFLIREALEGSQDVTGLADKLDSFLENDANFTSEPYLEKQPAYAPDFAVSFISCLGTNSELVLVGICKLSAQ